VDSWDAGFDLSVEDHAGASVAAFGSVTQEIDQVRSSVQFGKYGGQDKIDVRVGKVVNQGNRISFPFLTARCEDSHCPTLLEGASS